MSTVEKFSFWGEKGKKKKVLQIDGWNAFVTEELVFHPKMAISKSSWLYWYVSRQYIKNYMKKWGWWEKKKKKDKYQDIIFFICLIF